jgi:hypothetical protein
VNVCVFFHIRADVETKVEVGRPPGMSSVRLVREEGKASTGIGWRPVVLPDDEVLKGYQDMCQILRAMCVDDE